jgi:redox-sensitive bicupin YhaK (pirin superfamily)
LEESVTLPNIPDPLPGDKTAADAIELAIVPSMKDLGDGFQVRRALPSAKRQMVGPFIFFDQFGPVIMKSGAGLDVRPHPHIGLATVTWVFDGTIYHRDSLGSEQAIKPGELNWMTAGKGIVHSERTPAFERAQGQKMFGIQSWVALPKHAEETTPEFSHFAAAQLPVIEDKGRTVRLISGQLFGASSPARTHTDQFYAEVILGPGKSIPLPSDHIERGVYLVEGRVMIAEQEFEPGQLLVFKPGDAITISSVAGARFMMLGGEPMDGPRYIWWNFVSSSRERIEAAKEDWKQARFDIVPGDEKDFIPLP